ncbi:MAG: flagellar basal body protein [Pseudomonadota bacterium]
MVSAIPTALSGLQAAQLRVNVAANNIANAFSVSPDPNSGEQAQVYTPRQVIQSYTATGGTTASTRVVQPPAIPVLRTDNSVGYHPNVDFAQEAINLRVAEHSYRANAAVLRAQNRNFDALLDILT